MWTCEQNTVSLDMVSGASPRLRWRLPTFAISVALSLASRMSVSEAFMFSRIAGEFQTRAIHAHQPCSAPRLEAARATCSWALASSSSNSDGGGGGRTEMGAKEKDEPWPREAVRETESVSREALRTLRRQINEGAPASQTLGTLVDGVMVEGQELLTTEISVLLQRCPRLTEAARAGEISARLSRHARVESQFLRFNLERDVVAELDTPWSVSVKKWRQKALAVEKYRSTNPTANAAVYTYMANCCLRQGMWEVAYDALTYAGLMSAGPFFVSRKEVGLGGSSVVLDIDKMACYVAEKILDIDLDLWRRRGGDASAGAGTVGNNKPGVGIEERNFSQNEDSASHPAALRVQDMTLAAGRVALRKIRAELRESGAGEGGDGGLVVLASATTRALHLGELLLPVRAIETLLALDFTGPVTPDAELGQRLAEDEAAGEALGLLPTASPPVFVGGDALRSWLGQPDDRRAEEDGDA